MALQYKIDSLDDIDESQHDMYRKAGKHYVLDVEGLHDSEDLAGLKSKVDELISEKRETEKRAKTAEAEASKAREDAARSSGDIESLELSWQEKLNAKDGEIDALNGAIAATTSDAAAEKLASELAINGSEAVLIPHIKPRLAAESRDGRFVTVVLDAQGRPSATTIDELKEEIRQNVAFQPIIVGSNAAGGGATGSSNGGGATVTKATRDQFDGYTPSEKMEFSKTGGVITE